jgi:hypothetical protein
MDAAPNTLVVTPVPAMPVVVFIVVAETGSAVVLPYPAVGGVAKALMTVLSVASFVSAEFAD